MKVFEILRAHWKDPGVDRLPKDYNRKELANFIRQNRKENRRTADQIEPIMKAATISRLPNETDEAYEKRKMKLVQRLRAGQRSGEGVNVRIKNL